MDAATEALIEIGIIVAGPLDSVDRRATKLAIEQTRGFLTKALPEFLVNLQSVRRPELSGDGRVEPSVLLQQAAEDRDARHWDFAFVVTSAELVGNYAPFCFAALSRPLDAAVFSLSLLDPQAIDEGADERVRVDRIARRLSRLMLHALAHLTGLPSSNQPNELLFHPARAEEIDQMELMDEEQQRRQKVALFEIADQRLEEQASAKPSYTLFLMKAAWINKREIAEAVWGARPWEFPRRLSGLTIASVSTVVILFMTAEAWDLGLSQSFGAVSALIAISLVLTTFYVVVRQQLLVRRGRRPSEQTVVTSVSTLAIVLTGMSVTWLALLMIGFCAGWLLFGPQLISEWAASSELQPDQVRTGTIFQMSCFCASLGLLIGALGASFESQNYFRHVIFVDEEI